MSAPPALTRDRLPGILFSPSKCDFFPLLCCNDLANLVCFIGAQAHFAFRYHKETNMTDLTEHLPPRRLLQGNKRLIALCLSPQESSVPAQIYHTLQRLQLQTALLGTEREISTRRNTPCHSFPLEYLFRSRDLN